jgi:hypothetical protein
VNRLTMLVAPTGQWVMENSAEFFAALGDAHPDYDAVSFAVKNLGFVKFQIHDQSIIEIELHPCTIGLPALLAAQQQLLIAKVKLFRIRYFDTSWHSEILPSADLAVSRLSELCAPRLAPTVQKRFQVEPQEFSKLYDSDESALQLLAQKWRMLFGHFDPSVISFAIKQQMLSRMMIVGVVPHKPDPVFRFIGDGFKWLETDYQFYGIGEKIENQPDKEYGSWVAEFYKAVASTGQPRYDIVSAAIQARPSGPSLFLTRYERLLLPWRTPSEEVFVTLSSKRLPDAPMAELEIAVSADWLSSTSAKSL